MKVAYFFTFHATGVGTVKFRPVYRIRHHGGEGGGRLSADEYFGVYVAPYVGGVNDSSVPGSRPGIVSCVHNVPLHLGILHDSLTRA